MVPCIICMHACMYACVKSLGKKLELIRHSPVVNMCVHVFIYIHSGVCLCEEAGAWMQRCCGFVCLCMYLCVCMHAYVCMHVLCVCVCMFL